MDPLNNSQPENVFGDKDSFCPKSIVLSIIICTFVAVMEKKRHALRKLLEAVEKELLQKPNRKTLDRLSLLAGFQDWESFQETLHGDLGGETIYGGHHPNKKETPNQ